MKNLIYIGIFVLLCNSCALQANSNNQIHVTDVSKPVICLNGTWKFNMDPPAEFWKNEISSANWSNIKVPGECAMQGFAIQHDRPYAYKTSLLVPADYQGKTIILKFEGVYSYARVWVNGSFVRDHHGGFTAWECDITKFVTPGKKAWCTVEVTDKKDDLSYGSGYAKHQIGGILRSVWMTVLPANHLKYTYIETELDENCKNARLDIQLGTSQKTKALLKFKLYDPEGKKVKLPQNKFTLDGKQQLIALPVNNPLKWDAEHPNLYTLTTELYDAEEKLTYSKSQKVGFRKIEIKGNQLRVNGKPVKLRGACRHDVHPLLGRVATPEYDKKDVLLAREANMNFIRTSHYPPTETFLQYCDEYGIYVEDESAVCFVNTHRTKEYKSVKQSGPEFTHQYLSQVKEMVHYHRNHPSVIIWSVGNENKYEDNFKQSYDYIKSVDKTRPIMFSYPGDVPKDTQCFDILSMHYPSWQGNVGNQHGISIKNFEYQKMPVLFDEWAHVACYNKPTLQMNPNVRDFWGESMDRMWAGLFESEGGLGGAIWGMIDETFMVPDTLAGYNQWWGVMDKNILPAMYEGPCVGYGEWGIIDTWRRKKPEFWNTKKAYSPTKILVKEISDFQVNEVLRIPVHNRFDHTNFNELKIAWKYKNQQGIVNNPDLAPHQKGEIIIPGAPWISGEHLNIRFYKNDTFLIDEYHLRLGSKEVILPDCKSGNFEVNENDALIKVKGKNFSFKINKQTGLIEDVRAQNDALIKSGPYLKMLIVTGEHWAIVPMKEVENNWKLTEFHYEIKDGVVHIYTYGSHGDIAVKYHTRIDENGTIIIDYLVSNAPEGKYIQESGIKFLVGNNFNKMAWDRKAYWTAYPQFHMGMPEGELDLNNRPKTEYRKFPRHPWELDTKNYFYHGLDKTLPLTNIARALKENIYRYSLTNPDNSQIEILANADKSCRFDKTDEGFELYILQQWDYHSLRWGNYQKNVKFPPEYQNTVFLKISRK